MSNAWMIAPISTPRLAWGSSSNNRSADRRCHICGVVLLTGERAGFCCGPNGNRYPAIQPLPPLPDEFGTFLSSPDISRLSRKLNLIFSFAAMESTHAFPTLGDPSFVAVAGRVYHCVRPDPRGDTAIRWMLYDGFDNASIPHRAHARDIPSSWIRAMRTSLTRCNPFVSTILSLHALQVQEPLQFGSASIIVQDSGCAEIAAVMCYENTLRSQISPRSLLISTVDNHAQSIPTVSRLWEPMAYPLLFPHGTLGWGLRPLIHDPFLVAVDSADSDTPTTQIWHYRARLLREPRFSIFGRLTNEYVVDMFSRELDARLSYIRSNQEHLRAQEQDAALMGHEELQDSENIYLPASFLGSGRWSANQIADSLTIAATYGPPTFFVTFTCNGDWPEIRSRLRPGQTYTDVPVVVCRVFKQKLSRLMAIFRTMFPNAGPLLYSIQRVEFQKRGLPHAHILLKYARDCVLPEDIDQVISAHIPEAADDAEIVRRFMIHPTHNSTIINTVPPSPETPLKYCEKWKDGARVCRFGYPKPSREQTSFDTSNRVLYRRGEGDAFVVPYCLPLIRKFECHMNMEVAGCGQLFQYLFKYIHKGTANCAIENPVCSTVITGPDRAKFRICTESNGEIDREPIDEIEEYWSGRYLPATEGVWRILGYNITQKTPGVTALPVHLPDSPHHQRYHRSNPSPTLSNLEHYFARPEGSFLNGADQRNFRDLHYAEYFSHFRLQKFNEANVGKPGFFLECHTNQGAPAMHVVQRDPSRPHLSRLQSVHISRRELFYLRNLLLTRPGISWEDLRTIRGTIYPSFQAACLALGLFADKDEAEVCMQEAVDTLRTPQQLRILFVHLLTNSCVGTPLRFWDEFRPKISQDFILAANGDVEGGCNEALKHLGFFLQGHGKCLDDFGLPQPLAHDNKVGWELRRWSPQSAALRQQVDVGLSMFNSEQRNIFLRVQHAVLDNEPLLMFIDGKAGRGKMFLVNTLCAWVRSVGRIALPTATSAFAAQLYPGGRTTHSTFGVRM